MTTPHLWETPEITSINRLPMSSCLVPFPNEQIAMSYDRNASPWVESLNGTWDFRLFARPADVPAAVLGEDPGHELDSFRPIDVPSNWTLQDTGDKPIYTNVQMPWHNDPPRVPDENPTGVYRRSFSLPEDWHDRRVVLHIGGVESYFELYLDGRFVGMGKDTRLPSEFDLTPVLGATGAEGGRAVHTLAIKVLRWSDSSYVEDQDQWWMAGIYRDVYLYTTEAAFITDIFARADYDPVQATGILDVTAQFAFVPDRGDTPAPSSGPSEPYLIEASLVDRDRNEVWTSTAAVSPSFRDQEYRVPLRATLPGVAAWSSERPTLYSLVLTLVDSAGRRVESRCVRVGFRRVEIRDRELLVNGRPVMIRGVNRHEHDDRLGKVMTRELMLKDIRTLKSFNFNAVRTSHYPNTIEWYDLCDEYGIYLVDEANIEAHANYTTICRDPRWRLAFEERMLRMVVRDKNHPSIISWSAGNESGHGDNHVSAIALARAYDPSRPIHHEGEVKRFWTQGGNEYNGGSNRCNDIVNPMYPTIASIIDHATSSRDPRPVILCEYSHAMGNSNGSLAGYWDAFERHHGLQGGFIWEWVDHGIAGTDEKGRTHWLYGGDFGESVHDSNFVADGLVWPDRTPHPGIYEFKKLAQPLAVDALSIREGGFVIRSKQDFTSLDWLVGSWTLEVEGVQVDRGALPELTVPPGGELPVRVAYARPAALDSAEAYITFSFVTRADTPWCDAGHEVAWEQFRVNDLHVDPRASTGSTDGGERVQITNHNSLTVGAGGTDLISRGPTLNLFRATTDNDGIRGWGGQDAKPMGQWLAAGLHELRRSERTIERASDGTTIVERSSWVGSDPDAVIEFIQRIAEVSPDTLRFDIVIEAPPALPSLPRIGVLLETVPGFETVRWFGRGPQENHTDRKSGYRVGRYEGTVADQYVPYIMPQENGSKCEVRWFELENGTWRLRFAADPLFEFSVHHFTPHDLFACRHTNEVEDVLRPETVVSIDLVQRGVGTGSCGPQTLDPFCVSPGRYEFGFLLQVQRIS